MLSPPEGWTYPSRVLTKDLTIQGVNGVTPALQDELRNSYSQMYRGFDMSICTYEELTTSAASGKVVCSPFVVLVVMQLFAWLVNV